MIDCSTWSDDARAAYLASIIDNCAHIGVKRREPSAANKMLSPKYSVSLSIERKDKTAAIFLASFINADHKIKLRERPDKAPTYEFEVENERVATLLRIALPFMVGKRARAIAMLRLVSLRSESRSHRTKQVGTAIVEGGRGGTVEVPVLALSDDFNAACEAIYQALHIVSDNPTTWGKK